MVQAANKGGHPWGGVDWHGSLPGVTLEQLAQAYASLGAAKPRSPFPSDFRSPFTRSAVARIALAQGPRVPYSDERPVIGVGRSPPKPLPPSWMGAKRDMAHRWTIRIQNHWGKRGKHGRVKHEPHRYKGMGPSL